MSDKNFKLRKLNQQCENALKVKDFQKVITCYEKMYELTKDYHFLQKVANIHYKIYHNITKTEEIYKEIASHLKNESSFWWQYFEIETNMNKTYNAVTCVYNAIKIEIGDKVENNA